MKLDKVEWFFLLAGGFALLYICVALVGHAFLNVDANQACKAAGYARGEYTSKVTLCWPHPVVLKLEGE